MQGSGLVEDTVVLVTEAKVITTLGPMHVGACVCACLCVCASVCVRESWRVCVLCPGFAFMSCLLQYPI